MNPFKKYLDLWKEIVTTIAVLISVTVFCWSHFAIPDIIHRIKPVNDRVSCMNYVITKYIPQDFIDKYVKEYYNIIGRNLDSFDKGVKK
jgi:hypothetical protein